MPNGQSTTWRSRFTSGKEANFDRVKDLKTNTVMSRVTDIFEDSDHLTAKNYNPDKGLTGSSKWVRTSAHVANKASDLVGTYEYIGDHKGIFVYNEDHFAYALENKSSIPDVEITPENRMKSLNAGGGKWTLQDSIVTCTYQYHINPKIVGTSFRFVVHTTDGNKFESRVINNEGKVIGRFLSIRIN